MSGASAFGSARVRQLQRWGMGRLRRSRFFPVTIPDRLGDDDALAGTSLRHSVLVYFPETQESLYQLLPWLDALVALDRAAPVVVVCQDSRTAARVRSASGLDVLTIARYGRLDDLLSRSRVRLALYVSHSPRNFECLRFTSMLHVYLGHGDSDKGVSASNQVKAYDYCFVAGQAAIDRIAERVHLFDAAARCRIIGQPQLDSSGVLGLPDRPAGARRTVLYAPTWEGAQPSVAYSSVRTHGPALVRSLLDAGDLRVVYRPHPLTGVTSGDYARADAEIRALVGGAGDRGAVDTTPTLAEAFAAADLLVSDVSGVALSWLPTGRPLLVTRPATPDAVVARTRMGDVLPQLDATDAPRAAELVREHLDTDPTRAERLALVEYYLHDATPGAATARFVAACRDVIAEAERLLQPDAQA